MHKCTMFPPLSIFNELRLVLLFRTSSYGCIKIRGNTVGKRHKIEFQRSIRMQIYVKTKLIFIANYKPSKNLPQQSCRTKKAAKKSNS